jgi:hypothetical protein
MNGVEILAQNTIYETEYSYWWLFALLALSFLAGIILAIAIWASEGFNADGIKVLIATTLSGFLLGLLFTDASGHETDTIDHIEYKVIVADDVNFADFMNKYEILDQEDKIYTVKEKTND